MFVDKVGRFLSLKGFWRADPQGAWLDSGFTGVKRGITQYVAAAGVRQRVILWILSTEGPGV